MNRIRFGIVGLRGIGRGHAAAIAASDRANLVAVADIDRDLAREVASAHGANAWPDYLEMVEGEDLDAVVVATPHHLHAPMGMHCLESGLHTFIEKPIANTVSEADALVELAQERGLKLAIGHNYRTFPGNRALKDLLERGAVGRVCRVLWMWLEARPESYYDRDVWRTTWEHAGGGVLMNQASHDIDLLCWMMGDPTEVSAMVANQMHRAEVEDTVIANIRFASGAYCNVQLSTCDRRLNYRQISGEAGTIVYQDEKNHCCPNVWVWIPCKAFMESMLPVVMAVSDLKSIVPCSPSSHKGGANVHRCDDFLSAHAASSLVSFPSVCQTLPGESQGQGVQVRGPFSCDGFCAAYLPREPSGYRSVSSIHADEAVSHGD